MKILVLDANQRSALAATRSLGSAGFAVTTADETSNTLAGASRWSRAGLVYPAPARAAGEFVAWADAQLGEGAFDAVLPMTEITTDVLVRHRRRWPQVLLPFADAATIDALSNKVELYERALGVGVPVPPSVVVRSDDDLDRAVRELGFPAILKPARSRIRLASSYRPTAVQRIDSPGELDAALAAPSFTRPFLYQAVVSGPGRGIFALYDRGKPIAFFAHRRLREKPPGGGISVYSESCAADTALVAMARRLLDPVAWHGVAMVEFKGQHLMEINARFWGSLQLAIDAGVDFPRLLIACAAGLPASAPNGYRHGRRLRWWLGDLDRLYLVFKDRHRYGLAGTLSEVARFLLPDPLRTRHEVFRWQDPLPAIREAHQYVAAFRRGSDDAALAGVQPK